MKKSELKVGDKLVQITDGAGAYSSLKITDIENGIIGMGVYACSYESVHKVHKFVKEDGTLEEITNE